MVKYRKVGDVILREGDYVVIIIPRHEKYEGVAFQIIASIPLVMEYDKTTYIDPGASTDYKYLGFDGFGIGDDMLVIEDVVGALPDWKLYHFCIGVKPSFIRVYWQVPRGEKQTAFVYSRWLPAPGVDYDYFDGYMSPFDEPTDAGEFVIYKGLHIAFAFYNNGPYRAKPIIKIQGATYELKPVKNGMEILEKIKHEEVRGRVIYVVKGVRRVGVSFPDAWRKYTFTIPVEEEE